MTCSSPSSRRAWIEIDLRENRYFGRKSPSSRRAWIEIVEKGQSAHPAGVALLAEGVDRNSDDKVIDALYCVALLAEGVDRNFAQAVR